MAISIDLLLVTVQIAVTLGIAVLERIDVVGIERSRFRVLTSLAEVNKKASEFLKLVRRPERIETGNSFAGKLAYQAVMGSPILYVTLVGMYVIVTSTRSTPIIFYALWAALISLFISFSFNKILEILTRKVDPVNPSKTWLVLLYYDRSILFYLSFLLLGFLVASLNVIFKFISSNPVEAMSVLNSFFFWAQVIFSLGILIIILIVLRFVTARELREIENEFFRKRFNHRFPIVELSILKVGERDESPISGYLIGVGDSLVVKRFDRYIEEIAWKNVTRIAGLPNDVLY